MAQHKNLNTKQFVDIHDIKDGVVILKNGSLRLILEISSVNFDLKSSDEQTAIVKAFQNFLNSLDFPLQIVVHSRQLDIKNYLVKTQALVDQLDNELLKIQGIEYIRFVKGLTELANIMSKNFYVILPLYVTEAASKKSFLENIKSAFGTAAQKIKSLEEQDFSIYKSQIEQRAEIIMEGLRGMGLASKVLDKESLIKIFYNLFNPNA
ncbi:MAG: hypothetical protein HYT63_02695 [Candidatus Yanofskybacteria bacterium]|nr:hypothetical protein [Candidatus Yanofskybacteria bacterium]